MEIKSFFVEKKTKTTLYKDDSKFTEEATVTKNELLDGGLERVSQAAKRLGMDRRTLYHWIQEGKVTYTCINGVYRIPSRAVDEMLVAGLKIDPALDCD